MHQVYLILGSNEGNRKELLQLACKKITVNKTGNIVAQSAIYETDAWGDTSLPPHYNIALNINTTLTPIQLLHALQSIENELGRNRSVKWGLRTIDIDIIYYDNLVINEPQLIIPHPLMQDRKFVLYPLNDIAPMWMHPIFQLSNRALLKQCTDTLEVLKIS